MFFKLINDVKKFFLFKKKENKYKSIFFIEGEYLKPYLIYLLKRKRNYAIITFEKNAFKSYDHCYYFSTNIIRSLFFATLKIKTVYTSTPDLDEFIFKRSQNPGIKYIYIQHSPVSLSLAYKEKAFVYFDAVQVVNRFQLEELYEINTQYKKKIKPIKSKYFFLENFNNIKRKNHKLLLAPTWNTNFYKKNLHLKIKKILDENNIDFELRPHKMSLINNEIRLDYLKSNGFKLNLNTFCNYFDYNNLITDWSGIFIEFAMINKIKPICINSEKKIRNTKFHLKKNATAEFILRKEISKEIEEDTLEKITTIINQNNIIENSIDIDKIINKYFFK